MSALIAFDLDGTLEDSRTDMVAAIQRVRARFGLAARDADEFRAHVNRGMPHLYEYSFPELLADGRHAEVVDAYTADYSEHIADSTRLYDGIESLIRTLADEYTLAVVTNKPETLSVRLLEALKVADLFGAIIGGDSAVRAKPFPDPLAEAAQRCGSPKKVVMVGDSAGDIACARAYGCPVIWCAWGYAEHAGQNQPDFTAQTPNQVVEGVRRLLA